MAHLSAPTYGKAAITHPPVLPLLLFSPLTLPTQSFRASLSRSPNLSPTYTTAPSPTLPFDLAKPALRPVAAFVMITRAPQERQRKGSRSGEQCMWGGSGPTACQECREGKRAQKMGMAGPFRSGDPAIDSTGWVGQVIEVKEHKKGAGWDQSVKRCTPLSLPGWGGSDPMERHLVATYLNYRRSPRRPAGIWG